MTLAVTEVMQATAAAPAVVRRRDLRLDIFRGLALWFIFIDHIPDNYASWVTLVHYGFSDAAEIFVFISGYSAVIAYSQQAERNGWLFAAARIVRRVWELYAVHLVLFVIFTAQIAWVSQRIAESAFISEMKLIGFVEDPTRAITETALLRFQPENLDILPLYIVLLASFPLLLPAVQRWPWRVLTGSVVLWFAARTLGWNLSAYPAGNWFFNPFAWQLLFVLGAVSASKPGLSRRARRFDAVLIPLAVGYVLFAAVVTLSLHVSSLSHAVPPIIGRMLFPIDKTWADPVRVLHFLALAYLVQRLVPIDAAALNWRIFSPMRVCGRHSLPVFACGILLSFTAQAVLNAVDVDDTLNNVLDVGLSVTGILLLWLVAQGSEWYKNGDRAPRGEPKKRLAETGT